MGCVAGKYPLTAFPGDSGTRFWGTSDTTQAPEAKDSSSVVSPSQATQATSGDPESHRGGQNRWLLLASCVTTGWPGRCRRRHIQQWRSHRPHLERHFGAGDCYPSQNVLSYDSQLCFLLTKKPYHEKSPLKRVIFWFTCSNRPSEANLLSSKTNNSPLEMMVGFSLRSSLQIGFLSGDLLIFRASLDVSENSGVFPQKIIH